MTRIDSILASIDTAATYTATTEFADEGTDNTLVSEVGGDLVAAYVRMAGDSRSVLLAMNDGEILMLRKVGDGNMLTTYRKAA